VKRDALDDVFSQCVREAADWTCASCGLEFPDRKGRNAQCSHFYKRKYNSTRWFPDNCVMLCGSCHANYETQPREHTEFFMRTLGPVRMDMLRERWRRIFSYRPKDKAEMRAHYRAELERMLEMRRQGIIGPLEFAAYD
jgi:hypothetical protein